MYRNIICLNSTMIYVSAPLHRRRSKRQFFPRVSPLAAGLTVSPHFFAFSPHNLNLTFGHVNRATQFMPYRLFKEFPGRGRTS